jgi:3',5'-cyclic AMP phosphodiesterase CpdA
MRLAFTADLHWGIRPAGDAATLELIRFLKDKSPDVFVVAGDVGAGNDFEECLNQLAGLDCIKTLIPGNHDIWVQANDPRGDSLAVYENFLPRLCRDRAIHYLDSVPLFFP